MRNLWQKSCVTIVSKEVKVINVLYIAACVCVFIKYLQNVNLKIKIKIVISLYFVLSLSGKKIY